MPSHCSHGEGECIAKYMTPKGRKAAAYSVFEADVPLLPRAAKIIDESCLVAHLEAPAGLETAGTMCWPWRGGGAEEQTAINASGWPYLCGVDIKPLFLVNCERDKILAFTPASSRHNAASVRANTGKTPRNAIMGVSRASTKKHTRSDASQP